MRGSDIPAASRSIPWKNAPCDSASGLLQCPPGRRPPGSAKAAPLRTDDTDSVTGWIRGLGTSRHEDASKLLWDRYFARIARLAQGACGVPRGGPPTAKTWRSASSTASSGVPPPAGSIAWIAATTSGGSSSPSPRERPATPRGTSFARSAAGSSTSTTRASWPRSPAPSPSPEFAALVADESRRLFEALSDDSLRQVVRLRLEGYTNEEIAAALDCGLRTVERKLAPHPQALAGRGGRMSESRIGPDNGREKGRRRSRSARPRRSTGSATASRRRGDRAGSPGSRTICPSATGRSGPLSRPS